MFSYYKKMFCSHFMLGFSEKLNDSGGSQSSNVSEKNTFDLIEDIMKDGKIDGKDLELVEELTSRIDQIKEDTNQSLNGLKNAISQSTLDMMKDGYTVCSSEDYTSLSLLMKTINSDIKMPNFSELPADLQNTRFSIVFEGGDKILFYTNEKFGEYYTANTDNYGYVDVKTGKFSKDTLIKEFFTSFDDVTDNNNEFSIDNIDKLEIDSLIKSYDSMQITQSKNPEVTLSFTKRNFNNTDVSLTKDIIINEIDALNSFNETMTKKNYEWVDSERSRLKNITEERQAAEAEEAAEKAAKEAAEKAAKEAAEKAAKEAAEGLYSERLSELYEIKEAFTFIKNNPDNFEVGSSTFDTLVNTASRKFDELQSLQSDYKTINKHYNESLITANYQKYINLVNDYKDVQVNKLQQELSTKKEEAISLLTKAKDSVNKNLVTETDSDKIIGLDGDLITIEADIASIKLLSINPNDIPNLERRISHLINGDYASRYSKYITEDTVNISDVSPNSQVDKGLTLVAEPESESNEEIRMTTLTSLVDKDNSLTIENGRVYVSHECPDGKIHRGFFTIENVGNSHITDKASLEKWKEQRIAKLEIKYPVVSVAVDESGYTAEQLNAAGGQSDAQDIENDRQYKSDEIEKKEDEPNAFEEALVKFKEWLVGFFEANPTIGNFTSDMGDNIKVEYNKEDKTILVNTTWFDGIPDYNLKINMSEIQTAQDANLYVTEKMTEFISEYNSKIKIAAAERILSKNHERVTYTQVDGMNVFLMREKDTTSDVGQLRGRTSGDMFIKLDTPYGDGVSDSDVKLTITETELKDPSIIEAKIKTLQLKYNNLKTEVIKKNENNKEEKEEELTNQDVNEKDIIKVLTLETLDESNGDVKNNEYKITQDVIKNLDDNGKYLYERKLFLTKTEEYQLADSIKRAIKKSESK